MVAGIQVINDSGIYQIDDLSRHYHLREKTGGGMGADKWAATFGANIGQDTARFVGRDNIFTFQDAANIPRTVHGAGMDIFDASGVCKFSSNAAPLILLDSLDVDVSSKNFIKGYSGVTKIAACIVNGGASLQFVKTGDTEPGWGFYSAIMTSTAVSISGNTLTVSKHEYTYGEEMYLNNPAHVTNPMRCQLLVANVSPL
ncbi:hypothetical protein [Phyllobacterium sp. K27]